MRQEKRKGLRPANYGLQAAIVKETGISQSAVSRIFSGHRRPSPEQALLLEKALIRRGFSVTRVDMLYSAPGTPLLKCRAVV